MDLPLIIWMTVLTLSQVIKILADRKPKAEPEINIEDLKKEIVKSISGNFKYNPHSPGESPTCKDHKENIGKLFEICRKNGNISTDNNARIRSLETQLERHLDRVK